MQMVENMMEAVDMDGERLWGSLHIALVEVGLGHN